MNYLATITSKRQLTIPVEVFNTLKLRVGEKVLVLPQDGGFRIAPALRLIDQLAGSVKIPKRFQGLNINGIVKKAKQEHFRK